MGIREAYAAAAEIIGEGAECLDAALAVEELRKEWRPEFGRVLLLAESHVWTAKEEIEHRVVLPGGETIPFARFVYCLGYSGTWQFWQLFSDTLHDPDVPRKVSDVPAKLRLLEEMKSRGIWLVDASVTALYRTGTRGKLAAGRRYKEVLRACWEQHVRAVVSEYRPSGVLVIGKGVWGAIGERIEQDFGRNVEVGWVYQPQARLTSQRHRKNRQKVFAFCQWHLTGERGRAAGTDA